MPRAWAPSTGLAVLALIGGAWNAEAQQAVPPETSAEQAPGGGSPTDRVVYAPDFFARYSVNNAEDMLRLIPGVQTILNDNQQQQARGFGSGGAQILLNGRRFPGKSNEITGNLRRIPAATVARVELISGAASDISVQSDGILVNVVLSEGASLAGTGAWELNARVDNEKGLTEFDGLLSYKGSLGALSYSLGVERNAWSPAANGMFRWSSRFRDEVYYYASGAVQEARPQEWDRDHEKWSYTGGLSYDFKDGARFDLNGLFDTRDVYLNDVAAFTTFTEAGAVTGQGLDVHQTATLPADVLEISSEYNRALGPGNLQALAIVHRERNNNIDFRNRVTATSLREVNRTNSDQDIAEDIVRASYSFPIVQGQTIEFGAELARNQLDQRLLAYFDSDNDGLLEITPAQIAHVEEQRSELFLTHKWTITEKFSLESALNYETSKISSNYAVAALTTVTPERSLSFPKPRFDFRYRVNKAEQYRVLVERTVSQLDFNNFVPRLNISDNFIVAGNPNLQPEKTWNFEVGYERRLPGDAGLIEAKASYSDITDAIDKAPLLIAPGRIVAVQGNIPSATQYGAEVKSSVRLGLLGLPDSLLSVRYLRKKSETTDPFTGETRRLSNDRGYELEVNYRQDVRALGASFGFGYRDMGLASFSTDLVGSSIARQYFTIDPTLEAFVEKRLFNSFVLRIEAQNITAQERRGRYFVPLASPGGATQRYESYDEDRDARVAVRLRGAF